LKDNHPDLYFEIYNIKVEGSAKPEAEVIEAKADEEGKKYAPSPDVYLIFSQGLKKILNKFYKKKVKFIGEVLEVQGPIYKEGVTTKQLYKFLSGFKDLPYKGVFLNPSTTYDVSLELACRKALFKRPIGQSSTSLTIIVNTDKFNPDRNWKRDRKSVV
jgi:hypothetical protein